MRRTPAVGLSIVGVLLGPACDDAARRHPGAGIPVVSASGIRSHVRFLADDLLEGRGTGTRGYDVAAAYVAARFDGYGLAPAGTGESFYQDVPLLGTQVVAEESSVVLRDSKGRRVLEIGGEVAPVGSPHAERSEANGEVVFVGYGVSAPELGWDDYSGIEVDGKVVAMLEGGPPIFESAERAHFASRDLKARAAAERGAIGLLALRREADDQRFPWRQLTRILRAERLWALDTDGLPMDVPEAIRAVVQVHHETSPSLFAGAERSWEEAVAAAEAGESHGLALNLEASVRVVSRHRKLSSPNVAALLQGGDPDLGREIVAVTAHLDHEGIGEPLDGDAIYNGAVDNAVGIACLLEIARSVAASSLRPRRSLLFLAVTAEEHGLLGSEYFARYPTVDLGRIVANVNMDGGAVLYPPADVVALGAEHSSLAGVAERAALSLDLRISPDPWPEQNFFIRSDQYSFVRRGIPALFYFPGPSSSDPSLDGGEVLATWLATRYHTPEDDFEQPLDWEAGATFARLNLETILEIAEADERPAWNPGDFFGETFGEGEP